MLRGTYLMSHAPRTVGSDRLPTTQRVWMEGFEPSLPCIQNKNVAKLHHTQICGTDSRTAFHPPSGDAGSRTRVSCSVSPAFYVRSPTHEFARTAYGISGFSGPIRAYPHTMRQVYRAL